MACRQNAYTIRFWIDGWPTQVLAFDHGAEIRQRQQQHQRIDIRGSSLALQRVRGAKARNFATDSHKI